MTATRRTVLIAAAGTGAALATGVVLLAPKSATHPQPGKSLAERVQPSVTLRFDVAKLNEAGQLLRASVQSR